MKADAPAVDWNRPDMARTVGGPLEATALSLVERARGSLVVTDRASLEQAKLDRSAVYEAIGRVEEFFAPLKAMAHGLHAALCKREREILDPLKTIDAQQAHAIRQYHEAEERDRRRREIELAEALRVEREAQAAREAADYERTGEHALAAAVLAEAIAAPPVVVAIADPNNDLVTFRRVWKWKYAGGPVEVGKTPPHIVERSLALLPESLKCPDEKKIGAYVRSMKTSTAIPGIEIYCTEVPNR
jgi:hypothetical protein